MASQPHTRAQTGQRRRGERAALPAGTKRAFTRKDLKELAGTIIALWVAGFMIGIFYYAQLAGLVG